MKKKIFTLIIFVILLCSVLYGNGSILDSLLKEYKMALKDSTKCRLIFVIGGQYEKLNIDTSIVWYKKILTIAGKKKNLDDIMVIYYAQSLQSIGRIECINKSNYEKSQEITNRSISEYEALLKRCKKEELIKKAKQGISACNNILANINISQGNYHKALEFCLRALKISEDIDDKKGISSNYGSIGIIHKAQGNFDKALEYYFKALKIDEGRKDSRGTAAIYVNIGNIYGLQGNNSDDPKVRTDKHEKALSYYLKALKIFEELHNKYGMSKCYGNIGVIYREQDKYDNALVYYLKSLKISEELGDKNGIAGVNDNLASLHLRIADSIALTPEEKKNHLNNAIDYGNKSLKLADEIGAIFWKNSTAGTLMKTYKQLGNITEAFKYAQIFITTRDSMFKEEKTKALTNAEKKYQSEKKQKEIELLNKDKELQKTEIKRQTIQKYAFIIGFALMLIIAFLALFSYRKIRGQKRLIVEKNEELNQQNEEIRTQRDEIEMQRDEITAQRDTVTIQKEKLEEIHFQLTDSIHYAERIQKAVLPGEQYIKEKINCELFIFYKPKDIVSGDFYFIEQRKNWLLIAVADCTGHGVPGAFMSMLGISFLNEIIAKDEVHLAAHVLDNLREYIIKSLQQKGISGEQKDGMDIAFCAINLNPINLPTLNKEETGERFEMQFAGANNPCYIIANTQPVIAMAQPEAISTAQSDCFVPRNDEYNFVDPVIELVEIKGDKQPIGIYSDMQPFKNQIYQLQKGDIIYLMSDGYEDQFGGLNGKKFLSKNLKQLLLVNSKKTMINQKEMLEKAYFEWKGNNEQTDDITVMGIKI